MDSKKTSIVLSVVGGLALVAAAYIFLSQDGWTAFSLFNFVRRLLWLP